METKRKMNEEKTLPEYLKGLRKACRYKQDFVAAQLQITRQTYSHYETGRIMPSAVKLYRLAKLYGIPVEWLLACGESEEVEYENIKKQELFRAVKDESIDCSLETLLYYFRRLDKKDRIEIISLMKIKERMKKQPEELISTDNE